MSHSMLWGRSDMKEKFYSGSSQSNPWVRDLLWKKVIVEEKKKLNIPLVESVMGAPPFMRSVAMATMKAERDLALRRKAQLDAERAVENEVARNVGRIEDSLSSRGSSRKSRRPDTARSGFKLPASHHMKRAVLGASNSQPKLAPLNLDKIRRKSRSRGESSRLGRASSRMSQQSYRSTYSREAPPSVRSNHSVRSSATVRHLASLLKQQNTELRKGLRQQDETRRMMQNELRRMQQRVEMLDQKRAEEAQAFKKVINALSKTSTN